jgi:CBS domain-containing protein
VGDHMQSDVEYIHEDAPIEQALAQFARGTAPLLVVMDSDDQVVGILTLKEALSELLLPQAAAEPDAAEAEEPVTDNLEEVPVDSETTD